MVVSKTKAKSNGDGKVKAEKLDISQLVVLSAYQKTFSTGKQGWFGQCLDPATGTRYQIVGAVKLS